MKGKSIGKNDQNKKLISFPTLKEYIKKSIQKKYKISELVYGTVVIKNILFNEKTHIVAIFKDYLIADDLSEFLKRYYTKSESLVRLPRFFEYYETYSKIYPNYTALRESKYIYKNIHKKQKMIDLQQQIEESEQRKKEMLKYKKHKRNKEKNDMVFSTDIYNSIVNNSEDLYKLFGINKNKNSEKSIDGFNKLIKEIDKCELETPNSVFHSFGLELFISKGKNSVNNNKIKNMAGKLFSACTKQMNTISKEENISGNYRNYKSVLSDLQLINSNSINHKKTISSSSGNNSLNKKNNKTQIKKYYYNNNNQSYNNILPYSYKNRKKGEINDLINKIKVNINTNNVSIKKGYETDRVKKTNNINVIKNNNFNHNRKPNCILNSKGIILANNNNNINNIQYPNYKKKKLNEKNLNLNLNDIFSPKITKKIEGLKKENYHLKTNDFNLLRKYNNNNSSLSNSKVKTIINSTNHLITSSTINTSSHITNAKKKVSYKTNNYKNFFSTEKKDNKINVNILNESKSKSNKNNTKESPGQKKIIQGIQIKNFSKALRLSESISPKYGSNRIEIQNKKKIITPVHFSKPKTARSVFKKKI